MGTFCSGEEQILHNQVICIPNQVPKQIIYQYYQSQSNRYSQLSAQKDHNRNYIFTLNTEREYDMPIKVKLPVLSEISHCTTYQNYKLKMTTQVIVDIFDKKIESTYFKVKRQRIGGQFTMKVYPFKGFNSPIFKRALYEVWFHQQIKCSIDNHEQYFVELIDAFIYSVNEDKQAVVMLFESISTSLANFAEFRQLANWDWTEQEQLIILYHILQAYSKLDYSQDYKIYHRDIRPNNIFFVPHLHKFVLGNFSKSRYMMNDEDDLLTVYGVPYFVDESLKKLMNAEQNLGFYNTKTIDYNGIKSILNILQTTEIFDKNPKFRSNCLQQLSKMLTDKVDIKIMLELIKNRMDYLTINSRMKTEDDQINPLLLKLLHQTHKQLAQQFMFEFYDTLGYHKEFSDMAHHILQRNNNDNKNINNAPILKNLGLFYERNGTKGIQYFYNAFLLFTQKTSEQLEYGKIQLAQDYLQQAKDCYIRFSTHLQSANCRIQVGRLDAMVKLQRKNKIQAYVMMKQLLVTGANQKITIEKQLKLLISSAKIQKANAQYKNCYDRLKHGLVICQNTGVFQSPSICRKYKSNFHYELGQFYSLQYSLEKNANQQRKIELRGLIETNLKESLQIRQHENIEEIKVAQSLISLGQFYYQNEQYLQSKRCYRRALIQMSNMRDRLNPMKFVNPLYQHGSTCYYLKQFSQAKKYYEQAIKILKKTHEDDYFMWNIQGNLGLTMMELGDISQGRQIMLNAMEFIKNYKSQAHYDYVFLKWAYDDYYQRNNQ